jgi:hypothetical protein
MITNALKALKLGFEREICGAYLFDWRWPSKACRSAETTCSWEWSWETSDIMKTKWINSRGAWLCQKRCTGSHLADPRETNRSKVRRFIGFSGEIYRVFCITWPSHSATNALLFFGKYLIYHKKVIIFLIYHNLFLASFLYTIIVVYKI